MEFGKDGAREPDKEGPKETPKTRRGLRHMARVILVGTRVLRKIVERQR